MSVGIKPGYILKSTKWKEPFLVRMVQAQGDTMMVAGHYLLRWIFFNVTQVISEVLPKDSREKKLLGGFLAGREHIRRAIEKGDYSLFNGEEEPERQVTIDQFVRR